MIEVVYNAMFNSTDDDRFVPDVMNYPDGTLKINAPMDGLPACGDVILSWKYENEQELLTLIHLAKHYKEKCFGRLVLFMPYLPNARMDRTHSPCEVFTLKNFCEIINSLGFDSIQVFDVHSPVGIALLNRAENIEPTDHIRKTAMVIGFDADNDYLFFPDEGSCKRYSTLINEALDRPVRHIGFGIKKRNWDDGKIVGLDIQGEMPNGRKVLIIDDICSYGTTVYKSAEKLQELGCGDIYAYFSHCENSIAKGHLFDDGVLAGVYTTDSICTLDPKEYPKMHIFNIKEEGFGCLR